MSLIHRRNVFRREGLSIVAHGWRNLPPWLAIPRRLPSLELRCATEAIIEIVAGTRRTAFPGRREGLGSPFYEFRGNSSKRRRVPCSTLYNPLPASSPRVARLASTVAWVSQVIIGPIFFRELVTAPRRPQHFISRTTYVAALFILMGNAWLLMTGTQKIRNVGDIARFGMALFQVSPRCSLRSYLSWPR